VSKCVSKKKVALYNIVSPSKIKEYKVTLMYLEALFTGDIRLKAILLGRKYEPEVM